MTALVVGREVDVVGIEVDVVGIEAGVVGKEVDVVGIEAGVVGKEADVVGREADVVGKEVDVVGRGRGWRESTQEPKSVSTRERWSLVKSQLSAGRVKRGRGRKRRTINP